MLLVLLPPASVTSKTFHVFGGNNGGARWTTTGFAFAMIGPKTYVTKNIREVVKGLDLVYLIVILQHHSTNR